MPDFSQDSLDAWLPTLARYLGLFIAVTLTPWVAIGHWQALPGLVPAVGLMSYKKVRDAARNGKDGP